MAKKIEVGLFFSPNFSGLDRFVTGIKGRLNQVQAFSQQINQSAQGANQWLSTAAAAISGAKVVGMFDRMVRSGVNFNAQLEQANLGIAAVLKQFDSTGEFKTFDDALKAAAAAIDLLKQKAVTSPASFSTLVQAYQATVGPMTAANIKMGNQVKLLVNMSQALAGLGIHESQILQETRALITGNINADAAAAKILGITAADITAAKAKGQLYEFLSGKIAAFAEAGERGSKSLSTLQSNFGDMLEQRVAQSTEKLTEKLKGLFAALTDFAGSPAFSSLMSLISDKVANLVVGVTSLVGQLENAGTGTQVMLSLASSASTALLAITALVVPFILLRGLLGQLPLLLNPIRTAFFAIAGIDFVKTIRDLQYVSRTDGVTGAMKMATGWERAAAAMAVAGVALLGFQVGASIIRGLEAAALQRLEAENQVRQAAADQTKEFTKQLGLIRSITDARNTAAGIETVLTKAVAERDALEQKKKTQILKVDPYSGAVTSVGLRPKEADRLADLERQIFDLAQRYRLAVDQGFIDGQIAKNGGAAAVAAAKLTPEQIAARAELAERRALFELETQIREAGLDGNLELQERLIAERDLVTSLKELGQEGYDIAINRINLEAEERQKKRDEEAKDKADEKTKEAKDKAEAAAQLATAIQERELAVELAGLQREIAAIEANRFLTTKQKQEQILPLLQQENDKLAERLRQLDELIAKEPDPAKRLDLLRARDDVTDRQSATQTQITEATPLTPQQGALQGAVGFLDGIGTAAQNAAESVNSILNSALQGTSDILYGLATGSMTFREAWGAAVVQVGQQFAQMASDMVAKMIWRATIERALTALGVTTHVAGENAKTGATLAGGAIRLGVAIKEGLAAVYSGAVGAFKAMASIPFVGPILGAAAMAAAVAGGISLISKIGGHEQGGIVRGGKQLTWINENGEEGVIRAPSVRRFGEQFISDLNAGVLNLAALPGNIAATLPAAAAASAGGSSAGGSFASPEAGGQPVQIYQAFYQDRDAALAWLSDKPGIRRLSRIQQDNRDEFGLQS